MDGWRSPERPGPPGPDRRSGSEAGFTLLEILVSLGIMVAILLGLLALLEFNSRVAKAQINVSDMQQSLRVVQADMVRMARMAGRGGLPVFRTPCPPANPPHPICLPEGPSIGVANNVPGATKLGDNDSALVLAGTDVLTLRGVFNTPLYQIEPATDGDIRGAKAAEGGKIVVQSTSPTGVPQDLHWLAEYEDTPRPEGLLLVSAGSDQIQAVVELVSVVDNGSSVTINFRITDGTHTADYLELSPNGAFPDALRTVAMVGVLEEYRYYVRDAPPAPRLSRARFFPGTQEAYGTTGPEKGANLTADVADNILDLQVALGIDRFGTAETIDDTQDGVDDWLFNSPEDDPTSAAWNSLDNPLYYLRITTLARTDRIDPKYVSPPIEAIEDHVYGETAVPAADDRLDRSHRRRLLRTVVDLRNLS